MASYTIGQFMHHNRIVLITRAVAVQTPTHIHFLRHCDGHLAKLPVAMLATESGCNMGTVAEVDKIRQECHRHPCYGLVILNITCEFSQFLAGFSVGTGVGNLLVAAITHCDSGQSGRISPQCARMTIEAWHPQCYVPVMGKLDRLGWRHLGLLDAEDRALPIRPIRQFPVRSEQKVFLITRRSHRPNDCVDEADQIDFPPFHFFLE